MTSSTSSRARLILAGLTSKQRDVLTSSSGARRAITTRRRAGLVNVHVLDSCIREILDRAEQKASSALTPDSTSVPTTGSAGTVVSPRETELPMVTPGERTMYVILTADGKVRGTGKSAGTLYADPSKAQNRCRTEGDSVIEVTINLRQEPVFIRRRTIRVAGET